MTEETKLLINLLHIFADDRPIPYEHLDMREISSEAQAEIQKIIDIALKARDKETWKALPPSDDEMYLIVLSWLGIDCPHPRKTYLHAGDSLIGWRCEVCGITSVKLREEE